MLEIPQLGAIGLRFLLALMSYRLLVKEQAQPQPRDAMLRAIRTYMVFAAILVVVGSASEVDRASVGTINGTTTRPQVALRNLECTTIGARIIAPRVGEVGSCLEKAPDNPRQRYLVVKV